MQTLQDNITINTDQIKNKIYDLLKYAEAKQALEHPLYGLFDAILNLLSLTVSTTRTTSFSCFSQFRLISEEKESDMALADFMTVIPDFILLLTRAGANFAFANDYISMIMEIKRLVPRVSEQKLDWFSFDASLTSTLALVNSSANITQILAQGFCALNAYPHQDTVHLIFVVGIYFTHFTFTRPADGQLPDVPDNIKTGTAADKKKYIEDNIKRLLPFSSIRVLAASVCVFDAVDVISPDNLRLSTKFLTALYQCLPVSNEVTVNTKDIRFFAISNKTPQEEDVLLLEEVKRVLQGYYGDATTDDTAQQSPETRADTPESPQRDFGARSVKVDETYVDESSDDGEGACEVTNMSLPNEGEDPSFGEESASDEGAPQARNRPISNDEENLAHEKDTSYEEMNTADEEESVSDARAGEVNQDDGKYDASGDESTSDDGEDEDEDGSSSGRRAGKIYKGKDKGWEDEAEDETTSDDEEDDGEYNDSGDDNASDDEEDEDEDGSSSGRRAGKIHKGKSRDEEIGDETTSDDEDDDDEYNDSGDDNASSDEEDEDDEDRRPRKKGNGSNLVVIRRSRKKDAENYKPNYLTGSDDPDEEERDARDGTYIPSPSPTESEEDLPQASTSRRTLKRGRHHKSTNLLSSSPSSRPPSSPPSSRPPSSRPPSSPAHSTDSEDERVHNRARGDSSNNLPGHGGAKNDSSDNLPKRIRTGKGKGKQR